MTGPRTIAIALVASLLLLASLRSTPVWAGCSCPQWNISGSAISFTQSNGKQVRLLLDVRGPNLSGEASFGTGRDYVSGTVHGQRLSGRLTFQVRWNGGRVSNYELYIDDDGFVGGWGKDLRHTGEIVTIRGDRRLDCVPKLDTSSEAVGGGMENDTNRAFSDYHRFELEGRAPEACQNACLADAGKCRAWAYVRPGFQGPKALCYLKHAVPAPSPDKCCISGVAPARAPEIQRPDGGIASTMVETVGPGMENDTDRASFDYHRIELPGRTPEVCQRACRDDPEKCRAWTYVRPGIQGPQALCYLKHSAPAPATNKCCISGVEPKRLDRIKSGGGM